MREIANDIIDGNCCALCGQYFVKKKVTSDLSAVISDVTKKNDPSFVFTHGFPVACYDCWEPDCGYEKQDKKAKLS